MASIYLDYQASTPVDPQVLEAMLPFFCDSFGNPHSNEHSLGWLASQAVEASAGEVAQLIGSDSDEIVFTSGATESNNLALLGVARRAIGGKRNRLLISSIEHKSVIAVCRIIRDQLGYTVEKIPVDNEGLIILSAFQDMIDDDVLLVSIMAVNNEIGTIQNIKAISEISANHGVIFHCDAAQAPCSIDLKEASSYIDLMSLSAHKMYGPKGIGALFVRRDLQNNIEPLIYGGNQQRGLRAGTLPVALCVGMGKAAALLNNSQQSEEERKFLRQKRDYFANKLKALKWKITINGPSSANRHPGNIHLCFIDFSAQEILNSVQPHLAASTGSACTSGIPEPSHVLKAIKLSDAEVEASIRFCLGRQTSTEELDSAVEVIDKALSKLWDINRSRLGLLDGMP